MSRSMPPQTNENDSLRNDMRVFNLRDAPPEAEDHLHKVPHKLRQVEAEENGVI